MDLTIKVALGERKTMTEAEIVVRAAVVAGGDVGGKIGIVGGVRSAGGGGDDTVIAAVAMMETKDQDGDFRTCRRCCRRIKQ
mmetsp:Transcript_34897/g.56301  ORF Transcript_34897/g.56301 Transcript_34897/m.56301 type:complete len:82 (+) Transcript_34897:261-506(+)